MKQHSNNNLMEPGGSRAAAIRAARVCPLVLPLLFLAAPGVAMEEGLFPLIAPDPFQAQGWMVTPGLDTGATQGLYHEVWSGERHGSRVDAERHTGVRHRFGSGLGLDTGIAQYDLGPTTSRYQEYYFGLSYDVWQGRVWYTNDYQGTGLPRAYYEFGITGNIGGDFSLSARLGYGENDYGFSRDPHPAYVFSAQKRDLYGFGLNLQLMGGADGRRAESEDVRLMGTLSRSLP